ncbi:MAG: MazG nucleotide pyrophosphohydrolase domain-containing protein [Candidatus Izemoplasma sp.]|nr:MazG nucleotide pyrophosphohydrolase domain-containing protein [Candidatus Izemoplasma sp.]
MLEPRLTIKALQKHIKMVDHHPEKKLQVVLKLFEEIGELSEEINNEITHGLTNTIKTNLKHELYDVLHFINHIANIYDIDLEEAILEKDAINDQRFKRNRSENND